MKDGGQRAQDRVHVSSLDRESSAQQLRAASPAAVPQTTMQIEVAAGEDHFEPGRGGAGIVAQPVLPAGGQHYEVPGREPQLLWLIVDLQPALAVADEMERRVAVGLHPEAPRRSHH